MKILLTTPDYPPRLGGLSTFTLNLETILNDLAINYQLLVWKNPTHLKKTIASITKDQINFIINVHHLPVLFYKNKIPTINFFHGSEILFYSPNLFKHMAKQILKRTILQRIESSYINIFISNFTMEKARYQGLKINYARDIIIHNGISVTTDQTTPHFKSLNDNSRLCLVSIARDVPHKNLAGTVHFAEILSKISKKDISLYITSSKYTSKIIEVIPLVNLTDEQRDLIYKQCHFNLLLSLDNSKKGFFEGFGLTVLEAALKGTPSIALNLAGLSESIHHNQTGFLIDKISEESISSFWEMANNNYDNVAINCFQHTVDSHSMDIYKKIFRRIIGATNE